MSDLTGLKFTLSPSQNGLELKIVNGEITCSHEIPDAHRALVSGLNELAKNYRDAYLRSLDVKKQSLIDSAKLKLTAEEISAVFG